MLEAHFATKLNNSFIRLMFNVLNLTKLLTVFLNLPEKG